MTLAAGDYQPQAVREAGRNSGSAAVTKGVLMKWDPSGDGWLITAASASELGPFAVATDTVIAGTIIVPVVVAGLVAVTSDGAIEPGDLVQAASATAGQVITYAATTAATDATGAAAMRDDRRRVVGQYKGLENLTDGSSAITGTSGDAANDSIVWIDLFRTG